MAERFRLFVFGMLLAAAPVLAQDDIPDALGEWRGWVLDGKEYRACPMVFDRAALGPQDFACQWPGALDLEVTAEGGRFVQQWTLFGSEQWVVLPGGAEHWPDRVTANDRAVEVVARNGVPALRLAPGSYRLAGRFAWTERPSVLAVAPESGLVSLTVDGKRIARPQFNQNGIYLGQREETSRVADGVRATVHRLVVDDVPTRLLTRLRVEVSGSVREELFGPVLPAGFTPLSIASPLPARFESDGRLRLQVRPGTWTVIIAARADAVIGEIAAPEAGMNLPSSEVWSYQSNDRLRVTAPEGPPPVDPSQVEIPPEWSAFPAFLIEPGATLTIVERSRGIVSASNELSLSRTMWLDFDGGGFVVSDAIAGAMRTGWRLDMQQPFTLLSASEGGADLLITVSPETGASGVEIRETSPSVQAIGRSETRGAMAVTGWDSRFASVETVLHVPPGHKLFTAPGVDSARGSWTAEWQLLDFFLLLIITIAAWRLFGPAVGVVALFAILLSYQEAMAPTWLWLNLLVAIALYRVTPPGRLQMPVGIYRTMSALLLLLALIPFAAGQLRLAIYPQLEPQYNAYGVYEYEMPMSFSPADMEEDAYAGRAAEKRSLAVQSMPATEMAQEIVVTASRVKTFSRYAPNAVLQVGPGVPAWRWNTYALRWSGPVEADQSMRLVILPRWAVGSLRVVAVALLLLFAAALAAELVNRRWRLPGGLTLGRVPAAMVAICALAVTASPDANAEFPDADLLRELEARLTAPPDCVPRCAEIAAAEIDIAPRALSMVLTVHALEDVAMPLPGSVQGWRPEAVLLDGGDNARILRFGGQQLWIYVTAGRHSITVRGALPDVDSLDVPFPAPPRVVTVDSDGWLVAGTRDRRLLSGSLSLTRLQDDGSGSNAPRWEANRFPAFVAVDRAIDLDLDWRATTVVTRLAPEQGALAVEVPLLDGESIVSGEFTVRDGRVLVSMSPGQREVRWTSTLEARSPFVLTAQDTPAARETWRFAVGHNWNVRFDGLPESEPDGSASGARVAIFDPRAGESLTMTAARPEAAPGNTLAFDSVRLDVVYGARSSDATLALNYRSTRGEQHPLQLPANAEVTAVTIDDVAQTLRADNGILMLPVVPGEHTVRVNWRAEGGMGFRTETPRVDIGAPAGNIDLTITHPRDRWLLVTSGPDLGPAVMYWSELAVLVLFALIIGRVGLSPLRTWQWLLLGLGFSTFNWFVLGVVVVWLLVCGVRDRFGAEIDDRRFNVMQVAIAALTVISLLAIVTSLPSGLLGTPDMHVGGHNSYGDVLGWFADRSASALPTASAFTVPLWIYKVLILAWALWLSFALLRWLPWVWRCFSSRGFWRGGKGKEAAS